MGPTAAMLVATTALAIDGGVDETQAAGDSSTYSQVASFATTKLRDSPAVVTVITAKEIRDLGARDLLDVLMLVPGFHPAVDINGVVGMGFRGFWAYEGKLLLLIDGHEMQDLLYGNVPMGNEFPVELIERVEVVRGPGSVIYGGSAELTVINVISRGLQGATDVTATVKYGQLGVQDQIGNRYGRRGGSVSGRLVVDAVPGLSAFASASYTQAQLSNRTFTDYNGNSYDMLGQSQRNLFTAQAGVGYRDFQANFLYHRYEVGARTLGDDVLPRYSLINFESVHAQASYTIRPSDRFELVPRINFTYQRPWSNTDETDEDQYFNKSTMRVRARFIARWAPIDELQATFGIDGMLDRGSTLGPLIGLSIPFGDLRDVIYGNFATFIELFSENPIVNVAAGLRFDLHSRAGPALVPRVVLLRSFGPVNLKALFSMAFRAPAMEIFNAESPNSPARPERTTVFEFETGVDISKSQRFTANAFHVGIDAPLVYSVAADGTEGYENIGKQGTVGVEAAYRIRGSWGNAQVNYALYIPTLTDNFAAVVPGYPLAFNSQPNHRVAIFGSVHPGVKWISISPSLFIFGPRVGFGTSIDSAGMELEQLRTVDTQLLANLAVRFHDFGVPGLEFSVSMHNIFGTDYKFLQGFVGNHAPVPGLDREVMARITYLFEPNSD